MGGPGAVNAAAVSHLPARPRRDHVREIPEAGLLFDIRQMIEDGAGLRLRHHLPRDAEEKMGAFVLPRLTGRAPAHQPGCVPLLGVSGRPPLPRGSPSPSLSSISEWSLRP